MLNSSLLTALVFAATALCAPQAASSSDSSSLSSASSSLLSTSTALSSDTSIATISSTTTFSSPASLSSSAPPEWETDPPASDDPNYPVYAPGTNPNPEPIRGQLGGTVLGPQNIPLDMQNPDNLAPPTTDAGDVPNAKWPFSLSHNRLQTGGWARQQNVPVFPIATTMASVDMRLEAGAIRELHWHTTAEWAIVLQGYTQVTAVTSDGQNFIDTVGPGDLWYFPAGVPHSLQATDQDPAGTEFLLIFPDGNFNEDGTFLLTDWLSHVPKEVLAKNFQIDISEFDRIPSEELYIFPSSPPSPSQQNPTAPNGTVSESFTYHFSDVVPTPLNGGTIKIVDTRTFPIADTVVGAVVTVEPGAMRELHWHPTEPEWDYFIQGTGRMTLYAASGTANTFDFVPGDIGYVPPTYGHYVENIGNTTMTYLEIFNSNIVEDISLQQWLALIPPQLVQAHLGIDLNTIMNFNKTKQEVVM